MPRKLIAKDADLGDFSVKRILPHAEKKMVGPFIFFDHMGPADFPAGKGINVRPHPHIGLATVTYLFDGSILHRDSLGTVQEIFPGDVNWMTAGKGIVHSERETLEVRSRDHHANGLQCWLALPEDLADIEPSFQNVKKNALPHIMHEGVMMRLIAGEAYGAVSPVRTYSRTLYLDVVAQPGSEVQSPGAHLEVALYVIDGSVTVGGSTFSAGDFVLLEEGDERIGSPSGSRFMLLGGEAFEKAPYIHWNFVAYERETLDQARERWIKGEFPRIPGDDLEYIPLS